MAKCDFSCQLTFFVNCFFIDIICLAAKKVLLRYFLKTFPVGPTISLPASVAGIGWEVPSSDQQLLISCPHILCLYDLYWQR